jgi:hypothetical protein
MYHLTIKHAYARKIKALQKNPLNPIEMIKMGHNRHETSSQRHATYERNTDSNEQ